MNNRLRRHFAILVDASLKPLDSTLKLGNLLGIRHGILCLAGVVYAPDIGAWQNPGTARRLKTDRAYAWRYGRRSTRATLDEPSRLTNDLAEDYLALGQAESTPDRTLIRRSCNRHA
jgi:hypothetical protein